MHTLLIFSIVFILNIFLYECEVRFVFEIFRHGSRSPVYFKGGLDQFGESWSGKGELTPMGMRQHYLMGYRNRQKYQKFLPEKFNSNEIYVVSTDYNRTLQSAHSQLMGMFPPSGANNLTTNQVNNAKPPVTDIQFADEISRLEMYALPYGTNVFPVHTFDIKNKVHYLFKLNLCAKAPGIVEARKYQLNSVQLVEKFNQVYGSSFSKLLGNTNETHIFNFNEILEFCDTFESDYFDGRELKDLVNVGVDINQFNDYSKEFLYNWIMDVSNGNETLSVVASSPTMIEVYEWIRKRISDDQNNKGYTTYNSPKYVMYSAHDQVLGALQVYFQSVFNTTQKYYPDFASAVYIELHRADSANTTDLHFEDYHVEIFMNDKLLHNTTFWDFQEDVLKYSYDIDKITEFCEWTKPEPEPTPSPLPPNPSSDSDSSKLFAVSSILFLIVAIIEFIYIFYQRRHIKFLNSENSKASNYNII
jgi:hypothetical protein